MNWSDEGLVYGYSITTNLDRYVEALANLEECDDMKMLTYVFKYVFGDMIWSSRCFTVYSSYSGTLYFINILNIPLIFVAYLSSIKVVSVL